MTDRQLEAFPSSYAEATSFIEFRPFGAMPAAVRHLELADADRADAFPALLRVSDELSLVATVTLAEGNAWLTPETLADWGVTIETIATDVTSALGALEPDIRQVEEGTYIVKNDAYAGLIWLLPQLVAGLKVDGTWLCWNIGEGMTLITGDQSPTGYQIAAAVLTQRLESGVELETLTPHLHTTGGWAASLWPEEAADSLHLTERLYSSHWYGRQQEPLRNDYLGRGIEAEVSDYQVLETPDGGTISACIWNEGTPTLLPDTDMVLHVHTDGTAEPLSPEEFAGRADVRLQNAQVSPQRWFVQA